MRAIRLVSALVVAATAAVAFPASAQPRRQPATATQQAAPLPYVPPRGAWERKAPAELGFDAARRAEAVA